MKFKINVDGVGGVVLQIQKVSKYEPAVKACVVKSLAEMKTRSNDLTPKDTGELRNSAFGRPIGSLEGLFGYTKYYAPFVEYGHRIVRGGKQVGYVTAKPFLEPNARLQQPIFVDDVAKAIKILVR